MTFLSVKDIVIVVVINRFYVIDEVFFRSGRIDRFVYVFFLDLEVRFEIFKVYIRVIFLGDEVDLEELSLVIELFLGVDFENLCREVILGFVFYIVCLVVKI